MADYDAVEDTLNEILEQEADVLRAARTSSA